MVSSSFSLVSNCIAQPIATLRAPVSALERQELGFAADVWHVVKSELVARIVALSVSIFALVDCFVHLGAGLTEIGTAEFYTHLRSAVWLFLLTFIGTPAAFIFPAVLSHLVVTQALTQNKPSEPVPRDTADFPSRPLESPSFAERDLDHKHSGERRPGSRLQQPIKPVGPDTADFPSCPPEGSLDPAVRNLDHKHSSPRQLPASQSQQTTEPAGSDMSGFSSCLPEGSLDPAACDQNHKYSDECPTQPVLVRREAHLQNQRVMPSY